MAYCVQADIEKLVPEIELAELTTESGNDPDADVVAECISKADAEIDSYLGIKYKVPFSSAPGRVKSLSEDISIYYLYTRRSTAPEVREINYRNAIAYLQDVAAGRAVLLDGAGEATGGGKQTPGFSYCDRVFSRDLMGDF
jgi:phage gp36-like protein